MCDSVTHEYALQWPLGVHEDVRGVPAPSPVAAPPCGQGVTQKHQWQLWGHIFPVPRGLPAQPGSGVAGPALCSLGMPPHSQTDPGVPPLEPLGALEVVLPIPS